MVYSSFLVFFSVGATYRPLDGQGCHSHWMCGGGTPWDVQWSACLLPRGTEPGSCNDTAFSPIWGLTAKRENPQTHTHTHTYTYTYTYTYTHTHTHTRAKFNHRGESKTEQKWVGGWRIAPELLTIDHKSECKILEESVFLDSYQDSVLPSILLCYVPDHQGISFHVVSGALLRCHLAIFQPVRGETKKKRTLNKVWWGESK